MNSFESGRVWDSEKPPLPSYAITTSWLSFFQSAETPENTTFALILVPFEYGPDLDKRCRPYLQQTNDSWRVDETYIEVKGEWKYLDRAVDSKGNTFDFLLTARRDAQAAKRFLRKALKVDHTQEPRVINVDKNPAYPNAI